MRFWGLWGPPLATGVAIVFLSSLPTQVVPRVPWLHADKVFHFCEYVLLAYVLRRALTDGAARPFRSAACLWAIGLAAGYAALDEWHQQFILGRSSDVKDWIVDGAGILAAQALFWRVRRVPAERQG